MDKTQPRYYGEDSLRFWGTNEYGYFFMQSYVNQLLFPFMQQ